MCQFDVSLIDYETAIIKSYLDAGFNSTYISHGDFHQNIVWSL
jgi:hypothetical protein